MEGTISSRYTHSKYCLDCGYMLIGLSQDRCPECGRPFDRADRSTFRSYPRLTWPKRIALVLLVIVAVAASAIGEGSLVIIAFVLVYWWQRARRKRLAARSDRAANRLKIHSGP
jgi:hypothetical protein